MIHDTALSAGQKISGYTGKISCVPAFSVKKALPFPAGLFTLSKLNCSIESKKVTETNYITLKVLVKRILCSYLDILRTIIKS